MLVDLARNDVGPGRRVRHRARRRDDDARALQPRDAPHVAGVGRAAPTGTAPIDVLRATLPAGTVSRRAEGAGDGDHRRARAGEARPVRRRRRLRRLLAATSTRPSPSARCSSGRRARRCRPAPASWPTAIPEHEDLECRNKARRAARRRARRPADDGQAGPQEGTPRMTRRRGRDRRARRRRASRGPDAAGLPAGPAQPGRRRACRAATRPGRSCCSRPARSTAWLASTRVDDDDVRARRRRRLRRRRSLARLQRFKLRTKADHRAGSAGGASRRAVPTASAGRRTLVGWWARRGTASTASTCSDAATARRRGRRVDADAYERLRIEAGWPGHGRRAHRRHHPRPRPAWSPVRGQLHQGLLHGPGAGRPHRQPRRQRAPAPAPRCASVGPAQPGEPPSRSTARTSAGSRRVAGDLALGVRRPCRRAARPRSTIAGVAAAVEAIEPAVERAGTNTRRG